jgi:hypothetical protein
VDEISRGREVCFHIQTSLDRLSHGVFHVGGDSMLAVKELDGRAIGNYIALEPKVIARSGEFEVVGR